MIKYPPIAGTLPHMCRIISLSFTRVATIFYCFFAGIPHSLADYHDSNPSQSSNFSQISVLDGKTFAGDLGPLGEAAISTDLLGTP
jgi:hypothetical protein